MCCSRKLYRNSAGVQACSLRRIAGDVEVLAGLVKKHSACQGKLFGGLMEGAYLDLSQLSVYLLV